MTIKQREQLQNVSQQRKLKISDKQIKIIDEATGGQLCQPDVQCELHKKEWHTTTRKRRAQSSQLFEELEQSQTGCSLKRRKEDDRAYLREKGLLDEGQVNERKTPGAGIDHLLILAHSADLVLESEVNFHNAHRDDHMQEGEINVCEDPRRVETDNYHYRSNLNAILTLIKEARLRNKHHEELKKTPFWGLFKSIIQGDLRSKICKKVDRDIVKIIRVYNSQSKTFRLGGKDTRFTSEDIRLVFGISSGKISILKSYSSKPNTSFVKRRFANSKRIYAADVKEHTIEAARGNKETDYQDVARLLCLYTLMTLFFSTTGPTIGWDILKYIEDLNKIKSYAWSEKICKFLMDSIDEHFSSPEKVTGCVIALPYWLCEHTTLLEPQKKQVSPRLVKWNLRELNHKMKLKPIPNLGKNDVYEDLLKVTKHEKRFLATVEEEEAEEDSEDEGDDDEEKENSDHSGNEDIEFESESCGDEHLQGRTTCLSQLRHQAQSKNQLLVQEGIKEHRHEHSNCQTSEGETNVCEDSRHKDTYSYHYRSNLNAIWTIIKEARLRSKHHEELKKTPFWSLFKSIIQGDLKSNVCKKIDWDIVKIIRAYNPEKKTFRLGVKDTRFTPEDIRLVFGISSGKISIPKSNSSKPNTSFVERRFANSQRIYVSDVKEQIIEAATGNKKTDYQDVACLLFLYTLMTLFFPTSGPTIGWDILKYIEDLNEIKSYAWSEKICKVLMDSVDEHSSRPEKVTGCVIALLYWLCEHTTILEPQEKQVSPRLLKWNLKELNQKLKMRLVAGLGKDEVYEDQLKATKHEKRLLSVVEEKEIEEKSEDEGDGSENQENSDNSESQQTEFESENYNGSSKEKKQKAAESEDVKGEDEMPSFDGSVMHYTEEEKGGNMLSQLMCATVDDGGNDENEPANLVLNLKTKIQELKAKNEEQSQTILSLQIERKTLDKRILELEVHNVTQIAYVKKEQSINSHQEQLDEFQHVLMEKNQMIAQYLSTIKSLLKEIDQIRSEKEKQKNIYEEKLQQVAIHLKKQIDLQQELCNKLQQDS